MSNWGNLQLFWLQAANDSHFGDLQMSKKRYLLQKKMPYNISHLCGAIVSSFNGEQLKKCDSLYISKGIREYSRGVFITHDLGYPAYTESSEAKYSSVNKYFNKFCWILNFVKVVRILKKRAQEMLRSIKVSRNLELLRKSKQKFKSCWEKSRSCWEK